MKNHPLADNSPPYSCHMQTRCLNTRAPKIHIVTVLRSRESCKDGVYFGLLGALGNQAFLNLPRHAFRSESVEEAPQGRLRWGRRPFSQPSFLFVTRTVQVETAHQML